MQINLENELSDIVLNQMSYLVGNSEIIRDMNNIAPRLPFDEKICEFLGMLSKEIMNNTSSKQYPDVITFAF